MLSSLLSTKIYDLLGKNHERAVITGMGIVSSIGNNAEEVLESLKAGKSGINFSEQFAEKGLRSNVWGDLKMNPADHIDRKKNAFHG